MDRKNPVRKKSQNFIVKIHILESKNEYPLSHSSECLVSTKTPEAFDKDMNCVHETINLLLGRWNITDDLDLTLDVRLYTNSGRVRGYELVYKSYPTDNGTPIRLRINICRI